jgi:hypothetical protein
MHNAFEAITDLEPTFGTVYGFGEAYLTLPGRGNAISIERAIKLLEKGHRENPQSAGMLVRLAMIHWLEKKDRAKAMEYLRKAQSLPDMDSLSNQMLATLEAEQRDDLIALGRWRDFLDKGDEEMRERNALQFYNLKLKIADRAYRDFAKKHGRPPASPEELRDPELIQPGLATDIVLSDLELANGKPRYARQEELMLAATKRFVGRHARTFREERGRWPTLPELFEDESVRLPPAPPGQDWVLTGDRLELREAVPDGR